MSKHKKSIKVNNKSVIEFNRKYGFRLPIKPYRTGRIKRMRKGKSNGNTFSRRNRNLNYSHPYWDIALSVKDRWTRH